jgi:putative ABC transport system substrate-binding protein
LPVDGILGTASQANWSPWVGAMTQRLREHGWIDGSTIKIEYRWSDGRPSRFAEIATEFVQLKVDIIVTAGGAVPAVKRATSVIPTVFAISNDPIGTGLVGSLARPGGNVTGLSSQGIDLAGKRFELLREVVPGLRRLAILANAGYSDSMAEMGAVQSTAAKLGLDVTRLEIRRAEDIAPAFEGLKDRADALYVVVDGLVGANHARINTFALSVRLPTIYNTGAYVAAGGLMSYGPNFPDLFRRAAEIVDKILRGANPADLPVEQPTKFDLVINLTTARALGLKIPEAFLLRANEVIE